MADDKEAKKTKSAAEKPATRSSSTKKKEQTESLIYVGPNIAGGQLSQFTVFRGGIPSYLKDLVQQQPAIEKLIVPVNSLAKSQANSKKPGTPEHRYYNEILKGVNS